jgi:hypothetical protein
MVGELDLDQVVLVPDGAPHLRVVVLQPRDDATTAVRLRALHEPERGSHSPTATPPIRCKDSHSWE